MSKPCYGDDLWIMNADGSGQTALTEAPTPYAFGDPAWSPDGTKLAYLYASADDVIDTGNPDYLGLGIWDETTQRHRQALATITLLDHPAYDAGAFCREPYGPTWSPDGKRLAIQNYYGMYLVDVSGATPRVTQRDPAGMPYMNRVTWAPGDPTFAFEGKSGADKIIQTMPATGGPVTTLTPTTFPEGGDACPVFRFSSCDLHYLSRPEWSPDGRDIMVTTGAVGSSDTGRIGFLDACQPAPLRVIDPNPRGVEDHRYEAAWSPDGNKIVFSDSSYVADATVAGGEREERDVWVANELGAAPVNLTATPGYVFETSPDWQPVNPPTEPGEGCSAPEKGLEVTLEAFSPGGELPLDGIVSLADTITIELTLDNETEETLRGFAFTGDPLVIDPRGTGGLEIVSGPTPAIDPELSLGPGERATFTYEVETTEKGIAAAHSKVTAVDGAFAEYEEWHSLRFDIEEGVKLTPEVVRWLRMEAADRLMKETFGAWSEEMTERGQELAAGLSAVFTPEERLQWFGSETGLPVSPSDFAVALLRGTAAEMTAALRPKVTLEGRSARDFDRIYNKALEEEVGKGVAQYVEGYAKLARGTKKALADSWGEALLTANYIFGSATPQERAQFEAFAMVVVDGVAADQANLYNTVKREVPRWRENGTYLNQAAEEMAAMGGVKGFLGSIQKIKAVFDKEDAARADLLKLAQTDPVAFQQEWAKRDARILNAGMTIIFDTLMGGGVAKGAGALKNVVVRGRGASIMHAGEAAGVLDEGGNVVKGSSAIEMSDDLVPAGMPNAHAAELAKSGKYLEKLEGSTVVRSSDLGNIYELPNLGGVPEVTLDAKAKILGKLENAFEAKFGRRVQLAEVLKPSSPYRKPGAVAKLELTEQKTGKPAMLDAGAPGDVLGEAAVWTGPDPRTLPGFADLPKPRQEAAVKAWNKAEKDWAEYHNPTDPTSKTARLKQCVGQRSRVPLDKAPNETTGIQRFVTAEFEEVAVTEGGAQAKLIRAKYYRIEVVDTRNGNRVLNTKQVVDLPEAVAQGPDADAVALAKVVGVDDAGNPILAPLDRAEREFFMGRYVDENVKARRLPAGAPGAIPDAAEHGVTLVMQDAPAVAAGTLLPTYGAPFLGEEVGMTHLLQIAPHVTGVKNPTPAQVNKMYRQMVELVRKEGGFGQHAVVVTTDSRYLGAVNFARW